MTHRCRLCTANDVDGLAHHVAEQPGERAPRVARRGQRGQASASARRFASHAARSNRPSRIVASVSAALALPSGWRCAGVGLHGWSAAAGGAGITKRGIERVDPAQAVSIEAASAASRSLGISGHRVG